MIIFFSFDGWVGERVYKCIEFQNKIVIGISKDIGDPGVRANANANGLPRGANESRTFTVAVS